MENQTKSDETMLKEMAEIVAAERAIRRYLRGDVGELNDIQAGMILERFDRADDRVSDEEVERIIGRKIGPTRMTPEMSQDEAFEAFAGVSVDDYTRGVLAEVGWRGDLEEVAE